MASIADGDTAKSIKAQAYDHDHIEASNLYLFELPSLYDVLKRLNGSSKPCDDKTYSDLTMKFTDLITAMIKTDSEKAIELAHQFSELV